MPDEFQPMLDDLPPDVAACVIYVQEDISKWSYNTFKNLVRKHLNLAVNQLASVHGSPPCTTWSRAHHGKNPHRQRGKGRNLLPRTELARHHDKILEAVCDVMRNVSNQSFHTVLSIENPLSNFKHMPAVRCLLSSPGWMEHVSLGSKVSSLLKRAASGSLAVAMVEGGCCGAPEGGSGL